VADAQSRGWGAPCPTGSIVSISAGGRNFSVHKKVAVIFQEFITELVTRGYPINKGTLDDWSYNCRKISGSTSWSNHAWGLAVDINSLNNPMKSPLTTDMPSWVRDANYLMNKYGLRWGGTYSGTPDPMHYEFMLTPADADRKSAALREEDMSAEDVKAINDHSDKLYRYLEHGTTEGTTGRRDHLTAVQNSILALQEDVLELRELVLTALPPRRKPHEEEEEAPEETPEP
jgi:D-alanyl-D-alanine carboxypeptidase